MGVRRKCTGRSLVKVGGTYVPRAIGQYRTKPLNLGEGVGTGWRAPLGGEGTVRLSSKGESDRITQRSAVQIRPRNHERHCRNAVAFACSLKLQFPKSRPQPSQPKRVFGLPCIRDERTFA